MWTKDKTVYGINITRTDAGDKAVFDRTLSDNQKIEKIKTIMADLNVSEKEKARFSEVEREVEAGQTFAKATQKIYAPHLTGNGNWPNDNAVAEILSVILTDTTGIMFNVEWSEINDMDDVAIDPDGEDLVASGEIDTEYFLYVEPSMPWDEHVYRSEDDVRNMLLNAVKPFVYSHVHWPAEAQIGDLDCWYED